MIDKIFIDSNIWIYAAMADGDDKTIVAKKLTEQQSVTSTQVINEISVNLLRKYKYTETELIFFVSNIAAYCQIHQLTIQTCLNLKLFSEKERQFKH
ncbi:hypothetical protein WDW89_16190 [Deltaproteobacteria bacterium TL4]